jgi:NAD(P)H-hydrate epimerase
MENAGRNAARIIRRHCPVGSTAAIVCGRGNNGGDGFAIARHLSNVGIPVRLFLACEPPQLTGDAAINFQIAQRMDIPQLAFHTPETIDAHRSELFRAAVIVDAVLGTGFSGHVRSPLDMVVEAINNAARSRQRDARPGEGPLRPRVMAIDVPSGLDCDTGQRSNATVRADETITFVARKTGFNAPGAAEFLGTVHVVDIGAPVRLIEDIARTAEIPP